MILKSSRSNVGITRLARRLTRGVVVALMIAALSVILAGPLAAERKKASKKPVASVPSDEVYESLRKEYLHLRNTDIEIRKQQEWVNLAERLEQYADSHPKSIHASQALLYGAVLYEQIFRKFGGQDRVKLSSDLLEKITKRYPTDSVADDALLRRADLFLYDLQDVRQAKDLYDQFLSTYAASDLAEVARARKRSLLSGDYERWRSAEAAPAPTPAGDDSGRRALVVLDPGHGGEDLGAQGVGGLLEKDVTLAVAVELEQLLVSDRRIGVRLTRRKDIFVPLAQRIQFANDYEADLFVSLHTNASESKKLSGLETFYLDTEGDEATRKLVEQENTSGSAGEGGDDLQFMLSDLIQNAKLEESIVFAHILQRSVVNTLRLKFDFVRDLGVRKAPFYVLVGSHMPSVLTELFFIDNATDGAMLAEPKFRHEVALALRRGIVSFLERQGRLAPQPYDSGASP